MRFSAAFDTVILTAMASVQAAHAHPGHVHAVGAVHGYSWFDLAGFLLASVALPAVALLVVYRRNRHR